MLPAHQLKIVLVQPEIPQNTGNVARLCEVTGAQLHLVRPLGFFLSERHLKRAGMDYLNRVDLVLHDDLPALLTAIGSDPFHLASAKASQSFWQASYQPHNWLILGRETAGLPPDFLAAHPTRCVQIPMRENARCLNLATAAGIFLYEALRQTSAK